MTERRRVHFNAPIATGLFLDSRKAAEDGFAAVARASQASDLPVGEWRIAGSKVRESGMTRDVDDRRGTTILPRFLVERVLTGDDLAAAFEAVDLEAALTDESSGSRFVPDTVTIRLYEFGYGTLLASGTFECPQCKGTKAYRAHVESVSSLMPQWTPLARNTIERFEKKLPGDLLLGDSSFASIPDAVRKTSAKHDEAAILWVHRIFEFERGDPLVDEAKEIEQIVFRFEPAPPRNLSIDGDYEFYVGEGNSVIISGDMALREELDLLPRIIATQNAYFARLESFDTELFHYMNSLSRDIDRRNISGFQKIERLEGKSQQIVDLLEYAELFRSTYVDYEYHLDPQSRAIWKELTRCWGTENRFNAIEGKLVSLEKIYDRIRGSLRSLYDGQLNTFVIIFTLFGLLSVLLDMMVYMESGAFPGFDVVRIVILVAMLALLALLGYRILNRETPF